MNTNKPIIVCAWEFKRPFFSFFFFYCSNRATCLKQKGRALVHLRQFQYTGMWKANFTEQCLIFVIIKLKAVGWICVGKSHLLGFLPKVNNPVSVLTQEMSKYFLHSKGEGDKYKVNVWCYGNLNWERFPGLFADVVVVLQFFMKATQLDQMREDFVYIKTTKHVTEDKVEQHSEVINSHIKSGSNFFYYYFIITQ